MKKSQADFESQGCVFEPVKPAMTIPGWFFAKANYNGVCLIGMGRTMEAASEDLLNAMRIWPNDKGKR